jgi:GINS complex subunit 1
MVASLLKDLSQNLSTRDLSPYNDEGVRISIDEFKNLYQEFINCLKISDLDSKNTSCKAKTFILATQIKRYKRILLAYHVERMMKLSRRTTSSTDFSQSTLGHLSKAETRFYHLQADNIVKYRSALGHHINIFGPLVPPKDFYIQVRVEQDCGSIKTEYGSVTLIRGTMHYLKRNDVEHLIVRGHLTHII